jgi:hypothetical protein
MNKFLIITPSAISSFIAFFVLGWWLRACVCVAAAARPQMHPLVANMSRVGLFLVSHTLDRDETESVPNRDRPFMGLKLRPRYFEGEMSRKRQ